MTTTEYGLDTLDEDMLDLVTWAKQIKDQAVENPDDPFKGDIPPHVRFLRDSFTVAFGWAPHVNRDEGLELARMGARSYGADQVDFLVDAHMADERFIQKYGRDPDPLELQNLCDNEGACEIGLITDCILVARVTRVETEEGPIGQIVSVHVPYHVDYRSDVLDKNEARAVTGDDRKFITREGNTYTRSTRKTHWQDDRVQVYDDSDPKRVMRGTVPSALRALFGPTLLDALAEAGMTADQFGLTEHEARLHADIASTRMIVGMGFPIMIGAKSEEDLAIIERSVARDKNVNGYRPDGTVIEKDPDGDSELEALLGLTTGLRREEMDRRVQELHDEDLAEAARRRAARSNGQPTAEDQARWEAAKAEYEKVTTER